MTSQSAAIGAVALIALVVASSPRMNSFGLTVATVGTLAVGYLLRRANPTVPPKLDGISSEKIIPPLNPNEGEGGKVEDGNDNYEIDMTFFDNVDESPKSRKPSQQKKKKTSQTQTKKKNPATVTKPVVNPTKDASANTISATYRTLEEDDQEGWQTVSKKQRPRQKDKSEADSEPLLPTSPINAENDQKQEPLEATPDSSSKLRTTKPVVAENKGAAKPANEDDQQEEGPTNDEWTVVAKKKTGRKKQ